MRASGSLLNTIPPTIGVPTHVPIQDSHLLGVIATCTKNCSNFYRVVITHRTFNFTQRFTVTQSYEVNLRATTIDASRFSQCSNAGLLTPDSNPTEFNVFVHSRSHAAAASRVPFMARCNRQTISGGSFALGGGSTYNSRNTSLHRCAFFNVSETQLQRSIVSRYSLGHGFRNQKLDCFMRWSGCEEVRRSRLCVVAFLHLFRHQPGNEFLERSSPLFVSTHLGLITL